MKIIQITDLHINSENEKVRGDINVRNNFLKLIIQLQTLAYDYLVVSGDLCLSEGDMDTYQWIKGHLDNLGKPYFVISGNHDDNHMMAEVFKLDLVDGDIYYKQQLGNQIVYFLDTSSYVWSQQQMDWLKDELVNDNNPMPIIFIHHPPVVSGIKYMDINHPLQNILEAKTFFHQFEDKVFYIYCGHCHAENIVIERNMNVYVTPSNYFQMNKEFSYVEIENNYTSYRVIEVEKGSIKSEVFFIT